MPRHTSLAAKGLALLLATTVAANPIDLYRELMKRDPPKALPESASAGELKWQPVLDFDRDGCYNTPAIDAAGNIAQGLGHDNTGGADGCRDASDLDNNNVYVRSRCNHGWCAYVYDYYFEKDVAVQHVADAGGHRHDWEHIVVFVEGDTARVVAASKHGDYETKDAKDVRWEGNRPKMVYHKDGGTTHCFRFGSAADDKIENHRGVWFRGALVGYETGFPDVGLRDKLMNADFGAGSIAIKDANFKKQMDYARNDKVPNFDSGVDG